MRRLITILVTVLMLTSVVGGTASAQSLFGQEEQTEEPEVVRYGSDSVPSFVLVYRDGNSGQVESWANSSDRREVHSINNRTNVAVVSTHEWDAMGVSLRNVPVGVGVLDAIMSDPLAETPWVKSIGLNYRLSLAEPIDRPMNESRYEPPSKNFGYSNYDVPTKGIAFDSDANETNMDDSRRALGVDNTTATGGSDTRPFAIVDTGIATADGEVFGNGTVGSSTRVLNASTNTITNETIDRNGTNAVLDGNGHGTWVASAAAANTSNDVQDGVAPDAELLILKALDDEGSGKTVDIVESIRYAADQNASVISMSLGSPVYSDAIADATQYAEEQGSLVVVAAGNSRLTRSPGIGNPADVGGVISVAAVTGEEPNSSKVAYFSQYSGPQASDGNPVNKERVDIAAPGFKTTALVVTDGGIVTNETLSGTSMATPMVGAGAYIVRSQNQDMDVSESRNRVLRGARAIPNAGHKDVGNGMFALDNSLSDEEGTDQMSNRTDAAQSRDLVYDDVSDSFLPFDSFSLPVVGATAAT